MIYRNQVKGSELKDDYRLKLSHTVEREKGGVLNFVPVKGRDNDIPKTACIYVWAMKLEGPPGGSELESLYEILYVGKAGYGVEYRLGQHKGASKHNERAINNLKDLEAEVKNQKRYLRYPFSVGPRVQKKFMALKFHYVRQKKMHSVSHLIPGGIRRDSPAYILPVRVSRKIWNCY